MSDQALLRVEHLRKFFPVRKGFFNKVTGHVRAVDDVSFEVRRGETFGLVGESGCGKTTVGRCLLRAIDPTSGEIHFGAAGGTVDLARLRERDLLPLRREMQMIFQDPYSSLNARMTVRDIVGEPLLLHGVRNRAEREARVADLLRRVGIRPEFMSRYPHAFSGGQRQRIGIARAMALNPSLVVCDESVSALDVSIQAQILNLLADLQADFGLTYVFIAHDLSVIEHICNRVAVMYVGKIVEVADAERLFSVPRHPYTEALLAAIPRRDPDQRGTGLLLSGEVADPASPPPGCYFHPRCGYATDLCRNLSPELRSLPGGRLVACHRSDELTLRGVL